VRDDTVGAPAEAPEHGDDRSAKVVSSVENALRLLLMFRTQDSIRVSRASAELGVARSTAHRLLNVLVSYGFVDQDAATRAYGPGPRLVELGMSVARTTDTLSIVHPLLERLSAATDETVHFMVREGTSTRFVDSVESRNPLRVTARVGVVYPAHSTSGGKALLAELSNSELRKLYPRRVLPSLTDRTVGTREELMAEVEQIRGLGYAVNRGQSTPGISAVAEVLRDSRGQAHGAIAISAPEQRMDDDRLPDLAAALRATVAEGSALLS
jgi:IclR family acetate operon transcriptional repressor